YRWSVVGGTLPLGLSLHDTTGALSGTALLPGALTFTVRVADATGATALQPLSLDVARAIPPVEIVTDVLVDAVAGVPFSQSLSAAGGLGSYVWSLTGGELPAGASFSQEGVLQGLVADA